MLGIVVGDPDGDAGGVLTEGLFESGVMLPVGVGRAGFSGVGWEALLGIPVNPICMPVAGGAGRSAPEVKAGFAFVVTAGDETSEPLGGVVNGVGLVGRAGAGFAVVSVVADGAGGVTAGLFIAGVVTGAAGLAGTFVLLTSGFGLIAGRLVLTIGVLGRFAAGFATVPGLLCGVLLSNTGFLSVSEIGVCFSPRNMKYPPAASTITNANTTPSLTSMRMIDSFQICR